MSQKNPSSTVFSLIVVLFVALAGDLAAQQRTTRFDPRTSGSLNDAIKSSNGGVVEVVGPATLPLVKVDGPATFTAIGGPVILSWRPRDAPWQRRQ